MRWRAATILLILTASPDSALPEPSATRFQKTSQLHRERFGSPRTPEEHLEQLVGADPEFDADAKRETLAFHMRAAYDGLHYLLSDDLRAQFLGLSSDSLRGEWMRRYWVLRDPTPTTPHNERRDEHRRRVQMARRYFHHDEPPGWDDRGAFVILYGPPQAVSEQGAEVSYVTHYVPARKYWFYDDGVIVPFELRNPAGTKWEFGISAQKFSSRPDLLREAVHGQYSMWLGYGPTVTMYDDERVQLHELDPLNAAAIALTQAAASELLEERRERSAFAVRRGPRLWFVLDTDAFAFAVDDAASGQARTRLEAHVQLSLADLEFVPRGGASVARFGVEGVLRDEHLHEAARDAYEETLVATGSEPTQEERLVPGQLNFDVEPGEYRIAVRVVDLASAAEGSFVADVVIPALGGGLGLSDIELASAIAAPDAERRRFEKNGRLVLPHPISTYRQSDALTAYFEIYGLRASAERSSYRISYQIISRPRRRHDGWMRRGAEPAASVTSSFTTSAATSNPVEELRIDIGSLEPADYDLVVTVQDLMGGGEVTSATAFSVVRR